MNYRPNFTATACPHDCPSTCALEVELLSSTTIGRVRGAAENTFTDGVICAKVARYAERIHHPDRLTQPMRRVGAKGSDDFAPISWDDALDEIADQFERAEQSHGSESVFPYYYAGTMGLLMRDGINRLTHLKNYSKMYGTVCNALAIAGFVAGVGKLSGTDPREMAHSDVIVIWGANPVHTNINIMTHATKARKNNGSKIAVIDVYETATMKQADIKICLRPGTDAAFACAVMHILFRDGYADRLYLEKFTDAPKDFEEHLASKTPQWAAQITGVPIAEIEAFAKLIGRTPKSFFRFGYGFTRSRNGAMSMHAATCVPTVLGSWQHQGGGGFYSNAGIYNWDNTMFQAPEKYDPNIRMLDQSRIGPILTGDVDALNGGPQVKAMLIQNTNPMMIAPDLNKVHAGFARDDLFVAVHEQFMTETAKMADIVIPATMFMEHDDVYQGGGHQHVLLGPKIIDGPTDCWNNHEVICALAKRLGAEHPSFEMTPLEIIDWSLQASGMGDVESLREQRWLNLQPEFEEANHLNGFGHGDGKFHFKPKWGDIKPAGFATHDGPEAMPEMADYWAVIEEATDERPFRLVTAPARNYLNSSFTETPTSIKKEGRPAAKIHSADANQLGIKEGDIVTLGNERGQVRIHVEIFDDMRRGIVIVESIWPNHAFLDGIGINALTGADRVSPAGGGPFHDNNIWIRTT